MKVKAEHGRQSIIDTAKYESREECERSRSLNNVGEAHRS
jgi:hypothetical protein